MANNFWTGVIVGWLVGLILGFLLPVIGPLVGGFVAGWMVRAGLGTAQRPGCLPASSVPSSSRRCFLSAARFCSVRLDSSRGSGHRSSSL